MRFLHVIDFVKDKGCAHLFHEVIYSNREAIVVEKDLISCQPIADTVQTKNIEFAEIKKEFLGTSNKLVFPERNRLFKIKHYLNKGYNGYALLKDNIVIGDIWYYSPAYSDYPEHPDCKWLGLKCSEEDVYGFDMFLLPTERGKNLAVFLQNRSLMALRDKGSKKVYGYVWADNIPALWAHRMQKWHEIHKIKKNRFFTFKY
jgi:GNAT superfamily N-acetyltransferase